MNKPKVQMKCNHGIWTVSTVFYGVKMYAMAESVHQALSALQSDMRYVERELVIRVGGVE